MRTLDIKQTTTITISYDAELSDNSCIDLTEAIQDNLYEALNKRYPKRSFDMEWERDKEDYIITIKEEGTIKFYPSNDWYEPDDWDDPTTLQEEDIEEVMDSLYRHTEEVSYYVNSEWEEC